MSLCSHRAGLELRSIGLCLPSAGVEGVRHHHPAIDCLLIDNIAQKETAVIAGWSQVVQLSVLSNSKVFFLFLKEPHSF